MGNSARVPGRVGAVAGAPSAPEAQRARAPFPEPFIPHNHCKCVFSARSHVREFMDSVKTADSFKGMDILRLRLTV